MVSRQRLESLHTHKSAAQALEIIQVLTGAGYRTLLAGGCVRDALLGRPPTDLDLATAAPPEIVESLFAPHTLAVGKAFGTIIVQREGEAFEVTTFRRDGPYVDGRHPAYVEFSDVEEDAKRRDFTINALFYDPLKQEVLDFVNGQKDLHARVLQTVGAPLDRFAEDRLRILRAVRFQSQLGFDLASNTRAAIPDFAAQLGAVSKERIAAEMLKLLEGAHLKAALDSFLALGLSAAVWPEILHLFSTESLSRLSLPRHWTLGYAAVSLLANISKPAAESRLQAWRIGNASIRTVNALLHGVRTLDATINTRAERAKILGEPTVHGVFRLLQMLHPEPSQQQQLTLWQAEHEQVAPALGELPQPLLKGDDLLHLGHVAGKKMGLLLQALYTEQLEGRVRSKAEALEWVKRQPL